MLHCYTHTYPIVTDLRMQMQTYLHASMCMQLHVHVLVPGTWRSKMDASVDFDLSPE